MALIVTGLNLLINVGDYILWWRVRVHAFEASEVKWDALAHSNAKRRKETPAWIVSSRNNQGWYPRPFADALVNVWKE